VNTRALIPWAVAACFAFAAAWLGRLYLASRLETEGLRTQQALADVALKSADQQLEAERILARAQLAQADLANVKIAVLTASQGGTAGSRGVVVWNSARQEGVLALEKMPALAADQRLELWLIEAKADAKPVSAGVFELGADGVTRTSFRSAAPVGPVAKFMVSREKNDGARAHASPAVVIITGDCR
jgi:hypothetical protein